MRSTSNTEPFESPPTKESCGSLLPRPAHQFHLPANETAGDSAGDNKGQPAASTAHEGAGAVTTTPNAAPTTACRATAKRPLPLTRRNKNLPSNAPLLLQRPPSEAPPSKQLTIENTLADLQKLQPLVLHNPLLNRRVRWSGDKAVTAGLEEGTNAFQPMIKMSMGNNRDEVFNRKVTLESSIESGSSPNNTDSAAMNNNANYDAASESVVPGLMEVYDALTQSSTPQPGGMHLPAPQQAANYYPNNSGHQVANNPPSLPPIPNTRHMSQRGRLLKSGGSSDGSYSDTTSGSKRKSPAEVAKTSSRRGKKSRNEEVKKKSTQNDSRWSKRFTWPDELHREFVAAVFEVGLKHSSPSAIMEHMKQNPDVTSERVKSHLQKYRLNRQKSRNEFMTSYDRAAERFKNNPHDIEDDGDHSFSCGEVAALLTHSVQTETKDSLQSSKSGNKVQSEQPQAPGEQGPQAQDPDGVSVLHLPLLSEEESQSPLGQTFGYLVGMFQTLSAELEMKRRYQEGTAISSTEQSSQAQMHTAHHQHHHQSLEETAAAASLNVHDPTMYEVANVVPHAIITRDNPDEFPHQPYHPAGGMYRAPSHGYHHQHQGAAASSPSTYVPPQARLHVDQPTAGRHDSAAHGYHHVQSPSSAHPVYPPHQTPASVPTQDPNATMKTSSVPCPLDSSGSPNNPNTGRTLQAQKESSIMKQDMKSQKAFQNKMRALKQVELNKYGGRQIDASQNMQHHSQQYNNDSSVHAHASTGGGEQVGEEIDETVNDRSISNTPIQHDDPLDQEFWNDGDVNDQLFDFLMD